MSDSNSDRIFSENIIPIQELLEHQDTNRLLEGQTILGMIIQGHTQFQQWVVQLLQRPDNIDLIAVWENKLQLWKRSLTSLKYPIDRNRTTILNELNKNQRIFLKWNQYIQAQIDIAFQVYSSVLDVVTRHLLELNPIPYLEEIEAFAKMFNGQNNIS